MKSFSPSIHQHTFISENAKDTLHYFTVNGDKESKAILFLIGGSGHSSAAYTLAYYSKPLKEINACVYMLQKRHVKHRETGLGKERKDFLDSYYFDRLVEDEELFTRTMLAKSENREKKVIVLGVSEGATIAARIAADIPAVNYLGIVGSGGMTQGEELKTLYPKYASALDSLYSAIKQNPNNLDTTTMGYTYKYWSHILFIDPMQYFMKLDIPILIGQGEKDENVPVQSARLLQNEFDKAHKTNLTYLEFKDCDHTLRDEKGRSHLIEFIKKLNHLAGL